MDTFMEYIYSYAQAQCSKACRANREYIQNACYSEKHFGWLQENLDSDAVQHLKAAQDMDALAQSEELREMFRIALTVGLRLGALGQLAE